MYLLLFQAAVIPSEVNLTLSQTNTVSEVRVGTRVMFQLDIVFPLTPTDISVELFTPDNETTVMILCDVKIEHIGGNLGKKKYRTRHCICRYRSIRYSSFSMLYPYTISVIQSNKKYF